MNNEIEEVENWQWRWCDIMTGMPSGDPTGTSAYPSRYAKRYIQLGMKHVHKDCGGEIAKKFDTKWVGSTSYVKWWQECERCGKRFNETDYE